MSRISALTVAMLASLAPIAVADDPLPSAETVINQYIEATGGKAAYEKVKNRVMKGSLEIVGAGVKGTINVTQAAPKSLRLEMEIPGVEKTSQGTDGEVAWSTSALSGDRLLDGEEKDEFINEAILDAEVTWKTRYAKAECTGVEDVDGKPAYKVVFTPKAGKPTTTYYDKASHLLVKSISIKKTQMGELTAEVYPSDFKKVDGLLIPFEAKQKVLTQEIVIKFAEVKQNVDLRADTFSPPAAIKDLIEKAKKDK